MKIQKTRCELIIRSVFCCGLTWFEIEKFFCFNKNFLYSELINYFNSMSHSTERIKKFNQKITFNEKKSFFFWIMAKLKGCPILGILLIIYIYFLLYNRITLFFNNIWCSLFCYCIRCIHCGILCCFFVRNTWLISI